MRLFGLTIDSDLPIPGPPASGKADVRVRSKPIDDGTVYADYQTRVADDGAIDIQHEGVRYRVADGERIDVEYPWALDVSVVIAWLTGVAFGAILLQRRLFPFHANAVRLPGKQAAAAFAGPSGAGKSTLAAQLVNADYDLLGDDLLGVRFVGEMPLVSRGIPRLRLWQDAIDRLMPSEHQGTRVVPGYDKFEIALDRTESSDVWLPLERLYLLEKGDPDEPAGIERLSGAEAGRAVLDNAYRWQITSQWHDGDEWAFARCLDMSRHAEVYRFVRPWDLERADEAFAMIDRHLHE